jgi:hypothetical protein
LETRVYCRGWLSIGGVVDLDGEISYMRR